MNFSYPFIMRPVGTTLLAIGLLLVGIVAYRFLPVSSMPNIELPTIRVTASRPGADPAVIAATVAAPLERSLGTIAGVTEITSISSLGQTSITVQFDLTRKIDGAARDVPAAITSAGIALEDVRTAIAGANAQSPIGVLDGSELSTTIGINDQLRRVPD